VSHHGGGLLYVYRRPSSFVEIDRALLAERWPVRPWPVDGLVRQLAATVAATVRADAVVGWFAGWHTLVPITVAWCLGRPTLLIVGGVDTAAVPEAGYGMQRGGVRRAVACWTMRRARRLMTNSEFSRHELEATTGIPASRATAVHHGVPDVFGDVPEGPRDPVVLTVGVVDHVNLERKGLRVFARAATEVPEAHWILVGRWDDEAVEELRRIAPPNLELTGQLDDDALTDVYRRASVYVQASAHEGFGMAVAEAMLAGCVPVVSAAGALPEVVGDAGVVLGRPDHVAVAAGVRSALRAGAEHRARARRRALRCFPIERRRAGLHRLVAELLGEGASPMRPDAGRRGGQRAMPPRRPPR
jgi:glycosyltransferase involved in cell wall biosynthesis